MTYQNYRDKTKRKQYLQSYMCRYRKRQKTQEQAKDARLSELEKAFQKQTEEQTKQIEDAFKPRLPPDPEKEIEMLKKENASVTQENRELRERCKFQHLLLMNDERRNAVLETLLTNSSLARKR